MSEEEKRIYNQDERTFLSPTGKRYVLTNELLHDLELTPENVKEIFSDLGQFTRFQKVIRLGEDYGASNKKDITGNFVKFYKSRDKSKKIDEISLGSDDVFKGYEDLLVIPKEETNAEEDANFAGNVFGSVSSRRDDNKDTREINMEEILEKAKECDTKVLQSRNYQSENSEKK